jgi:hypothetical protein
MRGVRRAARRRPALLPGMRPAAPADEQPADVLAAGRPARGAAAATECPASGAPRRGRRRRRALSGQGPTPQTAADCPVFSDIPPGAVTSAGVAAGASGCEYPPAVATLPGQLAARRLSWRAYIGGLPNNADGPASTRRPVKPTRPRCRRRAVPMGPSATPSSTSTRSPTPLAAAAMSSAWAGCRAT